MKQRETLDINEKGHLRIGGCDCVELAKQYGTPLYVMDEAYIRGICRGYTELLSQKYPDSTVAYASKAFSALAVYGIVREEGLGADFVSGCELYTALKAGMPADKIYFHGNNKSPEELTYAVREGVHAVVVDSLYEIELLNEIACKQGKAQNVLVRVNPGIDAHTHRFIQTTRPDSKFGFSVADGTAREVICSITKKSNLVFLGVHCHIGSQIFELKPFALAVEKMTDFIARLAQEGIAVRELNMGGGYGVTYTEEDKPLAPREYVDAIVTKLQECIASKKIAAPRLIIEPGRSIVGEAGITLYTVGAIKEIKDLKKYIAVDGGMFENPRYALYQSKYDALLANRANEQPVETVTVAGKCCESGDMLIEEIRLPRAKSGDILAVFTTGAYNYSMASNYNRNAVPPVVLVCNGNSEYIVKPQTYEDIVSRDVLPARLGESK
ncbi:MAG: diaminopimelate decarboxylase [Clostridiales bacterium]|nr:diaminopimelate decarboxylase [Clostridiales bacterium]